MKLTDLKVDYDKIKKNIKVRKGTSDLVRTSVAHDDRSKWSKKDRKQNKAMMKRGVYEARILQNVRLTDHQKAVLALIASRQNENTTLVDLVSGVTHDNQQNMTAAVETLKSIGAIEVSPSKEISITDNGGNIAREERLIDDMGGVTPEGQQAIAKFSADPNGKTQQDVNAQMPSAPEEDPFGGDPFGENPFGEDPMGDENPFGDEKPKMEGKQTFLQMLKRL